MGQCESKESFLLGKLDTAEKEIYVVKNNTFNEQKYSMFLCEQILEDIKRLKEVLKNE